MNTAHSFNPGLILPSLKASLPGSNPLFFLNDNKTRNYDIAPGSDSPDPPGGPNQLPITLGPWIPTRDDIDFFHGEGVFDDPSKTVLHVCIYANCAGSLPPSADGTPTEGARMDWTTFDPTSFCSDQHHGQHNTTLQRTPLNQRAFTIPFSSAAPGPDQGGIGKVFVREPVFDPQAHRGVVEMIRFAGLGDLPIQPAVLPARVAGIARFHNVVERIEQKVAEIVHEGRKALEHLRGNWSDEDDESDPGTPRNVVTLQFAPGELRPLLLKVELNRDEPLGAVHVFDVVQLNQDGTRGGFRLAAINTPAV